MHNKTWPGPEHRWLMSYRMSVITVPKNYKENSWIAKYISAKQKQSISDQVSEQDYRYS